MNLNKNPPGSEAPALVRVQAYDKNKHNLIKHRPKNFEI
jgi:hypothetical protein